MDHVRGGGSEASCKTAFLLALLAELFAGGHRTLVFSQSRVALDIVQKAAATRRWECCRIDGTTPTEERHRLVEAFQTSDDIPLFLLSSQVGGLGLTLTAADRVVILDPAWNPSVDNQSVDRAYRIGQRKDVVVYRLITCGTVEEKIYRKQVFKGALSRMGTENTDPMQYFSSGDLADLFQASADGFDASDTQKRLKDLHKDQPDGAGGC
jgi:SNF2 family DNA or RNA helicase